ncbi:hypothetical protein ABLE93_16645 [Xanthobacter sp. KR7-65]|uniref:hypothetical protein n=1 Tax=Xanthobacter sp. KR7-65 TaxID=3156612 RepID=UPI0032B5FB66
MTDHTQRCDEAPKGPRKGEGSETGSRNAVGGQAPPLDGELPPQETPSEKRDPAKKPD